MYKKIFERNAKKQKKTNHSEGLLGKFHSKLTLKYSYDVRLN